MQGVYCPDDVHWARLEASALGSFCCLPRMERKKTINETTLLTVSSVFIARQHTDARH